MSLVNEMKLYSTLMKLLKTERDGIVMPRLAGIFGEWVAEQDLIDLLAIGEYRFLRTALSGEAGETNERLYNK